MIEVSPVVGGTIGPTETLGYPFLPINTLGGEEPNRDFELNSFLKDLILENCVTIGH
jgi:hypothetical protein